MVCFLPFVSGFGGSGVWLFVDEGGRLCNCWLKDGTVDTKEEPVCPKKLLLKGMCSRFIQVPVALSAGSLTPVPSPRAGK